MIVRALIGGIQKFSIEDGPGIRTTVFLKGCTLSCKWCHNPELIDFNQQLIIMPNSCISCGCCVGACPHGAISIGGDGGITLKRELCDSCMKCAEVCYARALQPVAKSMTVDEVIEEVEQDIEFYRNTGGGLTVSGGEILAQIDFTEALIDKVAEKDIEVCLDTSGYGDGNALMSLVSKGNVSHVLFDMKSIDNNIHREYTGVDNSIILKNLEHLASDPTARSKIIMRMPLVDGLNDTEEIIKNTAEYYKKLGIKHVTLLPYHNLGISKERNIGGKQEEFITPLDEKIDRISKVLTNISDVKVEVNGKL